MNTFNDIDTHNDSLSKGNNAPNVGDTAHNSDSPSGAIARVTAEAAQSQHNADNAKGVEIQSESKKKKNKKKHNIWWLKVSIISLVLAGFFSFLSELTASADQLVIIVILLAFLVFASILFDSIGVAVTSCDIKPIISMASRKVHGAKTALWLLKNTGTVSSICNDVIGDIFGIISGACSAALVVKIALQLEGDWQRWLTIIISAIVSAVTIGGKAFMKNVAINNSKDFVMFVARLVAVFNKEERKIRKKESAQKKQEKTNSKRADNGASNTTDGE